MKKQYHEIAFMRQTMAERARPILDDARQYYLHHAGNISYQDYERFKTRLHNECIFGYENELADILHI